MLFQSTANPFPNLSLFCFPTTHFALIALKPTDEKDSICLLPLVFDRLYKRLFLIFCEDITQNHAFAFFFLSLAIGHNRRRIGSIRVTLVMRLFFKSLAIGLPASRVGVCKDGSCPSVSDRLDQPTFASLCKDITLVMRLFSKSLAIGLPASRVGVRKDGSCQSVSDRLDPPTFPTVCKDITLVMRLFSKSLAIGLPASRVGVRKDGSCPSVSDRLDLPTFPTLCKDITLVMRLFSKSLAIGLPASRVGAYLRRSDSVRVYWTPGLDNPRAMM